MRLRLRHAGPVARVVDKNDFDSVELVFGFALKLNALGLLVYIRRVAIVNIGDPGAAGIHVLDFSEQLGCARHAHRAVDRHENDFEVGLDCWANRQPAKPAFDRRFGPNLTALGSKSKNSCISR